MKRMIIGTSMVAASLLFSASLNAQGLLGQGYFGLDGGWERLENGDSDDGWGVGAEINMPFPAYTGVGTGGGFGADLNVRADYVDVFDQDIFAIEGVARGYTAGAWGLTPFVGVGFGWLDVGVDDTFYVPLEAGVEFALGPVSLLPFFRYSLATGDVDDFWSVGADSVVWLTEAWGLRAKVTYSDFDDVGGFDGDRWGVRFGLLISY
jgi:hypothetical protein